MTKYLFSAMLMLMLFLSACVREGVKMEGKVLLVVAQQGFQPIEYAHTKEELEKAGFSIDIAAPNKEKATAADGTQIEPDTAIKDVNIEEYKAVVLIGGPGALSLAEHPETFELLRKAEESKKLIAAICISPVILAKAGILKGKRATVWSSPTDTWPIEELEKNGAIYTDKDVVRDGRVITANGPAAARSFGREISAALKA